MWSQLLWVWVKELFYFLEVYVFFSTFASLIPSIISNASVFFMYFQLFSSFETVLAAQTGTEMKKRAVIIWILCKCLRVTSWVTSIFTLVRRPAAEIVYAWKLIEILYYKLKDNIFKSKQVFFTLPFYS